MKCYLLFRCKGYNNRTLIINWYSAKIVQVVEFSIRSHRTHIIESITKFVGWFFLIQNRKISNKAYHITNHAPCPTYIINKGIFGGQVSLQELLQGGVCEATLTLTGLINVSQCFDSTIAAEVNSNALIIRAARDSPAGV